MDTSNTSRSKRKQKAFTDIGIRGRKTGVKLPQDVSKGVNGLDDINSFFQAASSKDRTESQELLQDDHSLSTKEAEFVSEHDLSQAVESPHVANENIAYGSPAAEARELSHASLQLIDENINQPNERSQDKLEASNSLEVSMSLVSDEHISSTLPQQISSREDSLQISQREITDPGPCLTRDILNSAVISNGNSKDHMNEDDSPKRSKGRGRFKLIVDLEDNVPYTTVEDDEQSEDENSPSEVVQSSSKVKSNSYEKGIKRSSKVTKQQKKLQKKSIREKRPLRIETLDEYDEQYFDEEINKKITQTNQSIRRGQSVDSETHEGSEDEYRVESSDENRNKSQNSSRRAKSRTNVVPRKRVLRKDNSSRPARNKSVTQDILDVAVNNLNEKPEDDRVRRSKRQRIKPVEFWRNERVVYRSDKTEVIRIPLVEEELNDDSDSEASNSKKRKRGNTKKTKRTDDATKFEGDVQVWGENEVVSKQLVYNLNMLRPKTVDNNKYKLQKTFHEENFFSSGYVVIPKGCEKPKKSSGDSALVFVVIKGPVIFTISEQSFTVRDSGQFFVPRGNDYSIKNSSRYEARLFFVQGKEVEVSSSKSPEEDL
ncbi:15979_t:CDS:10 [Acaulospora morrowiae]|uniref:CENP-C homolog n=1 Tax=Acaulospora morrowiae TaxID=94023 RepID=A0A9N9DKZ7_9GLOM|nr:15979_t:CDS:10 [Acaulospora morrowiae]